MAKSSINFQKTKSNSVAETTREFEANYLLPKEFRKKNEYWSCGKSDEEVFKEELQKAKRKGGRVPKFENSIWEAVLNLNENHTLEDVKKVAEHIEKKFNITCTRIAVHRDEGKVFKNENGETVKYNYHAHINFVTYKDGKQNWRRQFINKSKLSKLQTEVAKLLQMQRGEQGSKAVRANHRQLRQNYNAIMAQRESQKYNFREMQKRITALEQLTSEQKKELHRLNSKVKNKKAEVQELYKRIQELENLAYYTEYDPETTIAEASTYKQKTEELQKTLENQRETIFNQKTTIDILKQEKIDLRRNMSDLRLKNTELEIEIEEKNKTIEKQSYFIKELMNKLNIKITTIKETLANALKRIDELMQPKEKETKKEKLIDKLKKIDEKYDKKEQKQTKRKFR